MSTQSNVIDLDAADGKPRMTREEVINYLVASGVNGLYNSYNNEDKIYIKSFYELPIADIAPMWDILSDAVKLGILTEHMSEFTAWMKDVPNGQ